MFEWLLRNVKMGNSSGNVSSATSINGGWLVKAIDAGRELDRSGFMINDSRTGCGEGVSSTFGWDAGPNVEASGSCVVWP